MPWITGSERSSLLEVLTEAQDWGLVGPGPPESHLEHARGFAEVVGSAPEGPLLDLGSGGGLPGLVLAIGWRESRWVLLDSRERAAAFLGAAVGRLCLSDRVRVVQGRAEVVARDDEFRGSVGVVVARAFGPPAVAAELAAGFLAVGGQLVVSEPPGGDSARWDEHGLAQLGMGPAVPSTGRESRFVVVSQVGSCPARFPRRTGVPMKRPLF